MVKKNAVRMALFGVLALAATLTLDGAFGTAPTAQAEDVRAPIARRDEPHPGNQQRGAGKMHIAPSRGAAGQRRDMAQQRSSAMERHDDKKPAQMKRELPSRERGEARRGAHGTPRSR